MPPPRRRLGHAPYAAARRAARRVRVPRGPGMRLLELDEVARTVLREAGAVSPFLGSRPSFAPTLFPAVICASVNDAIVHGIPDASRLRDGDLVSIGCGALGDGWASDAAVSFTVGATRPEDQRLMDTTRQAPAAGVAAAVAGARIDDVSHAIGSIGRAAGYGIPTGFGGHGIGRQMHEGPPVPTTAVRGGYLLRPGLVIAIEPMFLADGADGHATDDDGWTLRTVDGGRAAHFEHMVAATEEGPRVLTLP
ncbi:type I methionyl aminopeptidase [Streptomyces lydicus]|uniref:type I methionyl aminopeptidase n=1 Tax=Streptomyces lydicus TaxID=47763 RepID=UPI00371A050D